MIKDPGFPMVLFLMGSPLTYRAIGIRRRRDNEDLLAV
jgi:hypothetical protein